MTSEYQSSEALPSVRFRPRQPIQASRLALRLRPDGFPMGLVRKPPCDRAPVPDPSVGVTQIVDIAVAAAGITLALPVLVLIALLVWAHDGGAPVFAHRRIGFGGRLFPCLKFRSMVSDAGARLDHLLATDPAARREWMRDHKLRDDPRITPLGRFLRSTSLDELPQLFNVLAGQMSLVGPRPIVTGEIERYGRYYDLYRSVRPGITGLWQVSGRNDLSYRRRVALDILYCRSKSIQLDFAILGRTIPAVLMRRGSA